MKNNLHIMFTALLMMFGMTAMAQEVTLDFDNNIATLFPTFTSYSSGSGASYVADGEFNETTTTAAVDGVTATVSASDPEKGTRNRLWATAPRLRMYDGTITFTSAGEKITKMEITRTTNNSLVANNNTVDTGSLTTSEQVKNGVITWTGEAQSVTITIAGNTQFSKVVLTLGGEVGPVKTAVPTITPNGGEFEESIEVTLNHEDPQATILYTLNSEDWNTAKEATPGSKITLTQTTVLRAKAFDYATTWSDVVTATFTKKEAAEVVAATCAEIIAGTDGTVYQVRGKCTEIKNTTYGNWNLEDETGTIYIYGTLDAEGKTKNFASLGIEVGDYVTVQGPRKDYNGTIELVDVTVIQIEKGTDTQPEIEEISVARALEIAGQLEGGKTTSEEYIVKGYVVGTPDFQRKADESLYGNVNFDMADTKGGTTKITVFRAKNYDNVNFTEETIGSLKEDDLVAVRGKLKNFVKDEVSTLEIVDCYLVNATPTAITTVKATANEGVVYNLQGQQVMQPTKGLYIVNGKKVIRK